MPVGTGFSYARTPKANHSTGLQACEQIYEFLKKVSLFNDTPARLKWTRLHNYFDQNHICIPMKKLIMEGRNDHFYIDFVSLFWKSKWKGNSFFEWLFVSPYICSFGVWIRAYEAKITPHYKNGYLYIYIYILQNCFLWALPFLLSNYCAS